MSDYDPFIEFLGSTVNFSGGQTVAGTVDQIFGADTAQNLRNFEDFGTLVSREREIAEFLKADSPEEVSRKCKIILQVMEALRFPYVQVGELKSAGIARANWLVCDALSEAVLIKSCGRCEDGYLVQFRCANIYSLLELPKRAAMRKPVLLRRLFDCGGRAALTDVFSLTYAMDGDLDIVNQAYQNFDMRGLPETEQKDVEGAFASIRSYCELKAKFAANIRRRRADAKPDV